MQKNLIGQFVVENCTRKSIKALSKNRFYAMTDLRQFYNNMEICSDTFPVRGSMTPPHPPPTSVRFLEPPSSPPPSPPTQRRRLSVEEWTHNHPFLRGGLRSVFTKLADTAFTLEVVEDPEEWRTYVDAFMNLPTPDTEEEIRAKDAIALSLLRGHCNISREKRWRRTGADTLYKKRRLEEIMGRLDGSFHAKRRLEQQERAMAAAAEPPRPLPGVSNPTFEEDDF